MCKGNHCTDEGTCCLIRTSKGKLRILILVRYLFVIWNDIHTPIYINIGNVPLINNTLLFECVGDNYIPNTRIKSQFNPRSQRAITRARMTYQNEELNAHFILGALYQ